MTHPRLDPSLASAQLRAALERAEGALRESQRQYHEIFELASVGIFRSTPEGRILLANPALAAMLGYESPDELRELDLARNIYLRPEERGTLVARYEHSTEPWTVEVEWRKRDGTPLWVQICAHAVPDDAGRTLYFESFVHDVTERRVSLEALRLSEARYRALATNLPDASVFLFDHDLRYLLADGTNFKAAGLSKEMLEGRTIWEILPADLCERLAPRYRAALGGQVVRFEEVYNERMYDVQLLPIRDAGGEISYGMGVSLDVTERQRAAARLAENETRLRAIIDAEPECVKVLDGCGRVLTMNPAGLAMVEADVPEQIVGQNILCVVAPEYHQAFADLSRRVFAGETGTLEFEIIGFKGTRRWLEAHAVPLRSPRGDIHSVLGITRDVTKRKRAEAQLRNLAARLEAIREEERSRIAREIHDEVGQALTALKMDLAWLGKKVPPRGTPVRRKLRGMERVIDATMDALHRILAELRPGVLDDLGLPAAIRWLAEEFKGRTEVACIVEMTGGEPRLDGGQATAVFRILQEALTNVARHAQARRVEIGLHVLPTAFELVVTDDGRGITAAEPTASGTLGILGMRERALTWHGRVTVHGEPGRGTTVRVFMPMDRAG